MTQTARRPASCRYISCPPVRSAVAIRLASSLAICLSSGWLGWTTATQAEMPVRKEYKEMRFQYPVTRVEDQVDDYHGTQVADPYRWLEDPDSEPTKAWVTAQNQVTFGYLESVAARGPIQKRLTELWNFERYGLPTRYGDRYFWLRNDGLQNQSVLYVASSWDGEARVLLDPNQLSKDGTVALAGWVPSEDGRLLAYGLATAGTDWREWKVMNVASGKELSDHIQWVKFSGISWLPDGSGFYYSRYDQPKEGEKLTGVNYFQKLFFHKLGDRQDQDALIYSRDDEKEWGFGGHVTEDGNYLVISVWKGTERKNQIFYRDLRDPQTPVVELISGFDAEYRFLGNDGPVFWLVTNSEAPRRRLIAVDTRELGRQKWREVIPESEHVIEDANLVGDRFFCSYLQDAHALVRVFDLEGNHERDVDLPGMGSVGGFQGRRKDRETFFSFTGFTTPGTIYRYEIETTKTTVFREPKVDFRPENFETEQVFFTSKDGTRIPMFLTHKRGLALNGTNPTILYGYGGFDIPQTPGFSVSNVVWLENGGVYAVVNLRGGGEYGKAWHEAGMKDRKQNVFDDFIAAAEWLIENHYTSPSRLAMRGGSNGGLLVGAVMAQRPELFGAAIPAVGVLDMLRYHKFTIGWAWVSEYGSSDDPKEFANLYAYSPLHNLKPKTRYPSTLIMTADHDDRVVPAHSFKFAATLQKAHQGDNPVLIRIESRAGHGAGTPTSKLIESAADALAFLANEFDMKIP